MQRHRSDKNASRFVQQLRHGAFVFIKGWKKHIVCRLFRWNKRMYSVNYRVGIQTVRLFRRSTRIMRSFFAPVGRFFSWLGNKLFARRIHCIAAEASRFSEGFALATQRVRTCFGKSFVNGLVCILSLPFLAVRRHKKALFASFNLVAPIAAAIMLVLTLQYWSGLTFALELEYNGQSIGYIANESVYNNVAAQVDGQVIHTDSSFVTERVPKLTVAVVPKAEILDESSLRDKLMDVMSDSISAGVGLYVNDVFVGAVEDSLKLNQIILNTLSAQRDGSGEDIASFVDNLQTKEGLFPTTSFIPLTTMEAYISRLDVQVTRLISYEEEIAFSKETVKDKSKYLGYSHLRTKGVNGIRTYTAQVVYLNGEQVSQTVLSSEITKQPVSQVTVVGAMTYTSGTTAGDGKATGKFIWPVPYTKRISSYFGSRWDSTHYGLDISASGINGKPIIACDGGKVIKVNKTNSWGGGWGYYVLIDHGNGYQTRYAHCSKVVVKEGQKVAQGELIAYVGNTGQSTGPHLHLEVIYKGNRVDPLPYLKASGTY